MKLLLVDDSPAMRKFVRRVVDMTGLPVEECREAGNGAEALLMLRESPADLILTDVNMPGMNGEQFLEALGASGLAVPPVIVVSTDATGARVERMRALGAVGYVAKPFTPEQFREQFAQALHTPAPAAGHAPAPDTVTVAACAQQVLETMFFCAALPAAPAADAAELAHAVGFGFFGGHPGRFAATADEDAVLFLAENFLDEPLDGATGARQLLGELANMVCGSYLSQAYPDSRFHLGTPQPMHFPVRPHTAWLQLDSGRLGFTLEARPQ